MSYLAEVSANLDNEVYDYHLPHTKTIDLIGEEFAPRKHNVIVESIGSTTVTSNISNATTSSGVTQSFGPNVVFVNANGTSSMPIQVQQLLQQAQQQVSGGNSSNNIVSVALAPQNSVSTSQLVTSSNGVPQTFTLAPLPPSAVVSSSTLVSLIQQPHITTQGNHDGISFTNTSLSNTSSGGHTLLATSLPFNPVTVDLPHNINTLGSEENGVLLCNLDELSKYIPENFYSDLCVEQTSSSMPISHHQVLTMPDYLQTVVAGSGNRSSTAITTTTPAHHVSTSSSSHGLHLQGTPIFSNAITSSPNAHLSNITQIQGPPGNLTPHPITIQLPTQPQPIQAVKTVTYVSSPRSHGTSITSSQPPVRLAYTTSGERIAIQGFDPSKGSNFQFQVKPQTLQFQVDPSKLTVLQELPEVGKVVIQEARSHSDSIASILEEMKSDPDGNGCSGGGGIEVTTGIPVAVSSLGSDPKKTTIKRVAAPASTVILPNKRSRNIIFAGNTLPQGAIPIQINGMNALPISAVKSLPAINLSALQPPGMPLMTSSPSVVAARKTRVEVVTPQRLQTAAGPPTALQAANLISKLTNNNNNNSSGPTIHFQKVIQQPQQQQQQLQQTISLSSISTQGSTSTTTTTSSTRTGGSSGGNAGLAHKPLGNNKTCNWVFENGEICGKTFSKSYNLVVHMRMHEDVRPFSCSLCDQTFRQKAHLQRHETTHGLGSKVHRSPGAQNSSGGFSNPKRKRKRSRGTNNSGSVVVVTSAGGSAALGGNIILPSTPVSATSLSENLQRRLAHVSQKFGGGGGGSDSVNHGGDDEDMDDDDRDSHDDEEEMRVSAGGAVKNYSKRRRYININGKMEEVVENELDQDDDDDDDDSKVMEDYRQEILEDADGNKIESSYVEVHDEDLRDEDIIEHVQPEHYQESRPIGLSHDNGTIQIIVTNGTSGIPTTLADMVSRMNHHGGGGQTILLQQPDQSDVKDDGTIGEQQHVVVTTSNEAGETIVIRNLEEHSPEMQKEILNALLQHHVESQQHHHHHHHDDHSGTTMRYVIDTRHGDDGVNVKVEAEPTASSGAEMSPESLTAISGHHPETSSHVIKGDDMNRISVSEFMEK